MTILPLASASLTRSRADLGDLGLGVHGVGHDAHLRAGERHRVEAARVDRHREQRDRDLLAGGEQHVHLALGGLGADVAGERDELVGDVPHRRDDRHHVVARLLACDEAIGDRADAVGATHRRAAELGDHQCHLRVPSVRAPRGAAYRGDVRVNVSVSVAHLAAGTRRSPRRFPPRAPGRAILLDTATRRSASGCRPSTGRPRPGRPRAAPRCRARTGA